MGGIIQHPHRRCTGPIRGVNAFVSSWILTSRQASGGHNTGTVQLIFRNDLDDILLDNHTNHVQVISLTTQTMHMIYLEVTLYS